MAKELPFNPLRFIKGSHQQTIFGSFFNFHISPKSQRAFIKLDDNDELAIEISTPRKWKEHDPTVVMIHGLCGSHKSAYLIRMAKKLKRIGIRAVRLNLRGCGSGKGRARKIYHGGQSTDVLHVLKEIKKQTPHSPIILIGFSLGGNIVLKLGGELKQQGSDYLHAVMAINPPMDMLACVKRMGQDENKFYERYFVKLMKEDLAFRQKLFNEDLPQVVLPKEMTLMDFDELYTAPYFGFTNAIDYYTKCSAINFASDISVPCRILFSQDDPIIAMPAFESIQLPENVEVYTTKNGGHMGYLSSPIKEGFHWLDKILIQWITQHFKWEKKKKRFIQDHSKTVEPFDEYNQS